jgi:hypothetical protein
MDTSIRAEKAKNWKDEVEGTEGEAPNGDRRLAKKCKTAYVCVCVCVCAVVNEKRVLNLFLCRIIGLLKTDNRILFVKHFIGQYPKSATRIFYNAVMTEIEAQSMNVISILSAI